MAAFAIMSFVAMLLTLNRCSAANIADMFPDVTNITNISALTINPAIMLNLSFLFGWQMAGAAVSQDGTSAACSDISSIGHGKWEAIGLDPTAIQVPMCDSSLSSPNATNSILFIIHYSTEIFAAQLLSAFNGTASFAYLCNNIKYDLLDELMLNDTAVLGPLCNSGGVQVPPQPFGPGHGVDPHTAAALSVKQTASVLYAYILAAAATSSSELNILCAHAPEYVDNLDEELMDGPAFQTALCEIKEPIAVDEARDVIVVLMTRMFITMVENVNNVGGWLGWLCDHVDAESMNAVGLFGEAVAQTICQDSLKVKSF